MSNNTTSNDINCVNSKDFLLGLNAAYGDTITSSRSNKSKSTFKTRLGKKLIMSTDHSQHNYYRIAIILVGRPVTDSGLTVAEEAPLCVQLCDIIETYIRKIIKEAKGFTPVDKRGSIPWATRLWTTFIPINNAKQVIKKLNDLNQWTNDLSQWTNDMTMSTDGYTPGITLKTFGGILNEWTSMHSLRLI